MKVLEFAALYGLVGLGWGTAVLFQGRRRAAASSDAFLLMIAWPLYGPVLLAARGRGAPILDVGGTSLAGLIPDAATLRLLDERLRTAAARVAHIDRLLAEPEHSEAVVRARHAQLLAGRDPRAAAAVAARLENLRRLRALRDRFGGELDVIHELIAQLRLQAELVQLSGSTEGAEGIVDELVHRLEGLDLILGEDESASPRGVLR